QPARGSDPDRAARGGVGCVPSTEGRDGIEANGDELVGHQRDIFATEADVLFLHSSYTSRSPKWSINIPMSSARSRRAASRAAGSGARSEAMACRGRTLA